MIQTSVTILGGTEAIVEWAVPQLRVGAPETNDDIVFFLTVRTPEDTDDIILYTQDSLVTTTASGTYLTAIPLGVAIGTYDLGFKGAAHVTKILNDVTLVSGTNTLNFSQTDNSAPKGSEVLFAGDVSGDGTSPATLGDDVINSVDLSILLGVLDDDDPTGNDIRSNLNQDIVVNSVDLSIMIDNLDLEGEN
ncbi:MAG: hypothetical protein ABII02_04595 [Candidatus Magasanikbacteria bacterium]